MVILVILFVFGWIKVLVKVALALLAYLRLVRACRGTGVRPSDALASARTRRV